MLPTLFYADPVPALTENPDKIQVSVSSYDNLVATEGSVRGPNDEKVEEVVRLFRRQGRGELNPRCLCFLQVA